jgi:deoxyribodipyrimidine photo-lyase
MFMGSDLRIFWFRRDLRLIDNRGLYAALMEGNVLPLFIFDRNILDKLGSNTDSRVQFIHMQVMKLAEEVRARGGKFLVYYGYPEQLWPELIRRYRPVKVHVNRDYEPYARKRDAMVASILQESGVLFESHKDQVLFEADEILSGSGSGYTVYTPYSKKWVLGLSEPASLQMVSSASATGYCSEVEVPVLPALGDMGFLPGSISFPSEEVSSDIIRLYESQRNFPSVLGTSRLGIHLRFGTISVRALAREAMQYEHTFLKELAWREFFMQIMWHFPYVSEGPFKKKYSGMEWRHDELGYAAWCEGRTGYAIVDAGMRELAATGFMHNRVRMIAASFLVKHLLIDYRWGEAWFAEKLLDFDLASNNGNWQWVAGTGCDAAPYFRVFNPDSQALKFDSSFSYIRKWVPEFEQLSYIRSRVVEHTFARDRALSAYKVALAGSGT